VREAGKIEIRLSPDSSWLNQARHWRQRADLSLEEGRYPAGVTCARHTGWSLVAHCLLTEGVLSDREGDSRYGQIASLFPRLSRLTEERQRQARDVFAALDALKDQATETPESVDALKAGEAIRHADALFSLLETYAKE
jgi:hypothetical protein